MCKPRQVPITSQASQRQQGCHSFCRSRAYPRWRRCGASKFAVSVSQASQLQQGRGSSCRSRACPRWRRRGTSDFAVFVSQASQLQQGCSSSCRSRACPRWRRRGASEFTVFVSHACSSSCRSGLARDDVGAVPVSSRRLYRRQASSHRAPVKPCGRLARDGVGAVPVSSRRLYRRQASSYRVAVHFVVGKRRKCAAVTGHSGCRVVLGHILRILSFQG